MRAAEVFFLSQKFFCAAEVLSGSVKVFFGEAKVLFGVAKVLLDYTFGKSDLQVAKVLLETRESSFHETKVTQSPEHFCGEKHFKCS